MGAGARWRGREGEWLGRGRCVCVCVCVCVVSDRLGWGRCDRPARWLNEMVERVIWPGYTDWLARRGGGGYGEGRQGRQGGGPQGKEGTSRPWPGPRLRAG